MDCSKIPNTKNKIETMGGGTVTIKIMEILAALAVAFGGAWLWWNGIYGIVAIIAAVLGMFIAIILIRSFSTEKKQVAESWSKLSPQEIEGIEAEAADALAVNNIFFTHYGMVQKLSQGPRVIPARDMLWIYAVRHKQKIEGPISYTDGYSITIMDRSGEKYEIVADNAGYDDLLDKLIEIYEPNYPGMVFGYTKELKNLSWDLDAFAEMVDRGNAGTN